MSTEPKVRFMQDGPLGTVTVDRPPLNLVGADLIADLVAALDEVEAADGVRALVLRGAGNVFSAGADPTGAWSIGWWPPVSCTRPRTNSPAAWLSDPPARTRWSSSSGRRICRAGSLAPTDCWSMRRSASSTPKTPVALSILS